jgi:hypothetical protein
MHSSSDRVTLDGQTDDNQTATFEGKQVTNS